MRCILTALLPCVGRVAGSEFHSANSALARYPAKQLNEGVEAYMRLIDETRRINPNLVRLGNRVCKFFNGFNATPYFSAPNGAIIRTLSGHLVRPWDLDAFHFQDSVQS